MTIRYTALAIVAAGTVAFAQSVSGPTFDVVSIKRHIPEPGTQVFNATNQRPDGGITITNTRIMTLIVRAYPGVVMLPTDIVGMPGWAMNDGYDVSATSTLTQASADDRAAMMRAMLVDRFKLVAHVEPREHPVFDLVLAREDKKLGAGLTKIDADCAAVNAARTAEAARSGPPPPQTPDFKSPPPPCFLRTIGAPLRDRFGDGQGRAGDLMEGELTMDGLATALRISSGRVVVDKTGLPGSYRIRMEFDMRPPRLGPDVAPPADAASAIPSVFTAVREQLGLKLESSKTVRNTLIIDRLERPSEN
jgi:uncharacterized protein (TIGR03435 family)